MVYNNMFWARKSLRQRCNSAPRCTSSARRSSAYRPAYNGLDSTACVATAMGKKHARALGQHTQRTVQPVIATNSANSTPMPPFPFRSALCNKRVWWRNTAMQSPRLLLALIALVLASACTTQPKEKDEARTPTPQQRVVTLGGSATEIAYALGAGAHVVGTDLSSTYPAATSELPKVGYWRTLSVEGVLSLRPTTILADYGSGPEEALSALEQGDIAVHRLPEVLSFQQSKEKIQRVATLLHREREATVLLATMERHYSEAMAVVQSHSTQPKTLFLYIRGSATMNAGGIGTPAHAMIQLAGGNNVASMLDKWKPVSAEFFVQAQPDILIVTTSGLQSLGGMKALQQVPGLRDTPALRNNRVVVLDDLAFLGFGPRMPETLHHLATVYAQFARERIAPTTEQN